jgi:uncharacterized protein
MATPAVPQDAPEPQKLIANPLHTLLVLALVALNAYRGAMQAEQARADLAPNRPYMYLRIMFFEFLILAIVVVGVRLRRASLQTIFGQRWRTFGQMIRDLGIGVLLLLAMMFLGAILSGHQNSAASQHSIKFLMPQTAIELSLWIGVSITAGICEEAIFRGYLQRQFTAFTRSSPAGIFISAVAFGAVHAYQGLQRAFVIGISAILFGLVAHWRGTVRPGMFAHALQDGIAPLLIKLIRH